VPFFEVVPVEDDGLVKVDDVAHRSHLTLPIVL
jgi:hypothetical protein